MPPSKQYQYIETSLDINSTNEFSVNVSYAVALCIMLILTSRLVMASIETVVIAYKVK